MGSFFVNYQIRGSDAAVVVGRLSELAQSRAYVSPANNGWITVYDLASDSQDNNEINRLAGDLSSRLGTALFAFLVHDSDVFAYYLYDRGDLIDEYNSKPGYFGEMVNDEARQRLAGQPAVVLNYCRPGTTLQEVEIAMGWSQNLGEGGFASSVFAEDRLRHWPPLWESTKHGRYWGTTISKRNANHCRMGISSRRLTARKSVDRNVDRCHRESPRARDDAEFLYSS